ncbi:MAG: glycerophosphodiester phosphodiesterase [Verrucomicrobia bacterium]|nr:glycerophosphodiester phosphodiesterase [Verrucomicrobiota bacterium]
MKNPLRVFSQLSVALLFSCMTLSVSAVEIIAHRGASYDAPENNLSAIKLGWKQKADAVEFDIHLSKDGKLVSMHDYDTKRIGGVNKKIVDQTWDELQKLDVGSWKGPKFAGERIPTTESILATVPKGKAMFIEIKVGPEILPELGRVMAASGKKPEQLTMITFNYNTAQAAKAQFPKHEVYYLHGWKKDKDTGKYPEIEDLIKKAKDANLDGLNLNYNFPIDKAFVQKVHAAGLKLYTWTVNDPAVAKALVAAGVDGITTDRPEYLRKALKQK